MTTSKVLNLVSLQNSIATEPFKDKGPTQKETGSRFIVIEQKHSLTELKVLFSSESHGLLKDDVVYVKGDNFVLPWAKTIYTIDNIEFILVPLDSIILVNRNESFFQEE
jgi:hypothetical protein